MVSRERFTTGGRIYLWVVILAGCSVFAVSLHQLIVEPIGRQWFILAALTLISGSATVKLPTSYASISTSETFTFTAVLLYGPAAGTVIVVLDALVISFWISKRRTTSRAIQPVRAGRLGLVLLISVLLHSEHCATRKRTVAA